MNKLSRQLHDGYIINESKIGVQVAARAMIALGSLAFAALILMHENDAADQPSTPNFRPRTGSTFELPYSTDGPGSSFYLSNEEQLLSTAPPAADHTP